LPAGCSDKLSLLRCNVPDPLMFDASGYAVFKQTPPATGIRFDLYLQFGRPARPGRAPIP
jgi:hypothetical protein